MYFWFWGLFFWNNPSFSFSSQLPPPEPESCQVSSAAAVGWAGCLLGAGNGRGMPTLHPESFPSQHHLWGQPLAAAGPAWHCQHPHMDLPEGGRGTQKLQELNPQWGLLRHRPPSPPTPGSLEYACEPSNIVIMQSFFKSFTFHFLKKSAVK